MSFACAESRATIKRAGEVHAGLHGMPRQHRQRVRHALVEVDRDHVARELLRLDLGQEVRRVGLELLEEDAVLGDLAHGLAVGRAAHAHADRHRGAVAGDADHAHVVAEILAAELRADAHLARELQHLLLHLAVADGHALVVALARQVVEVARRGELHRLEVHLGRGAADHDGEVVGRAGRGAQGADLGVEELQQRRLVQHRRRLLVEVALVGRAAALGDEQELVGIAVGRDRCRSAPAGWCRSALP